jgi:hypothetical protein
MEREYPPHVRHIHLRRGAEGSYVWSCSECYWCCPVSAMETNLIQPIDAIEAFSLHICTNHERPEEWLQPFHTGLHKLARNG